MVWGGVALCYDYPRARAVAKGAGDDQACRPGKPWALAKTALPLGVNGLLAGLQGQIPRYAIGATLGVAALGQFTVAAYAIQAVTKFVMALGQALMTRLAQFVEDRNVTAIRRVMMKMLGISLTGGGATVICAFFLGDWVMVAVFGPLYENLGLLLTTCMGIATARACVLILQAALFALRRFKEAAAVRFAMMLLSIGAVLVGVQLGGLIGVSIAVVLTSSLHALALWGLLQRYLRSI